MPSRSSVTDSLLGVLMSNPWFAGLPGAVRADIVSRARGRVLAPGQRLFSRGDMPDGIYAVLEGTIRVSGVTQDGRETVLDFYGPGTWFAEVSALDGGPRAHDVQSNAGAVLLLHLGTTDFENLLANHAAFSRAVLTLEAQRLRFLLMALESYSTQSMTQRLASRLLILARGHGKVTPRGVEISLPLSQETLARLIGSTRQRVNQILKDWAREGLVKQRSASIVLLDRARLEQIARL